MKRSKVAIHFVVVAFLGWGILYSTRGVWALVGAAAVMTLYFLGAGFVLKWQFNEDEADAIYFLGFLFTVSLLAAAFLRLESRQTQSVLTVVLRAVGQGLLLTVYGLFGRQIAILWYPVDVGRDDGALSTGREPARATPVTEGAVPGDTQSPDANREVSGAVKRLRELVAQIDAAADGVAEAVRSVRALAGDLESDVRAAGDHIRGGAQQAAQAIVQAAGVVKEGLHFGIDGLQSGYADASNTLQAQSKLIHEVAANHTEATRKSLDHLLKVASNAEALADAATTATIQAAGLLAERARQMPDPAGPTRDYAEALRLATDAIGQSHSQIVQVASAVAKSLRDVEDSMGTVAMATADVLERERETLDRVRGHFSLFARLEEEYIALVEDVAMRARRGKQQ